MAASNIVNKKTSAYIDFQFGMVAHADITEYIVLESITDAMISRLSRISLEFDENCVTISDFTKRANKRRVHGWFSCAERDRDLYITAFQKIMTDRTVSKLLSTKTKVKSSKININQLMMKFSNDFDVESPHCANTQCIPDKYLQNEAFRSKSLEETKQQRSRSYDQSIISQLRTFGYSSHDITHAMDQVVDAQDINSIVEYMDDTKENLNVQVPSTNTADFSGVWKLEGTDNLDAFMKSEGCGHVVRKLMSTASMTLTIKHDLGQNSMEIKAKTPVGEVEETLMIDGKSVCESVSPFGDKSKIIADWADVEKKEGVVMYIDNVKTKKRITMERYMVSENELCEKMVNESDVVMVRTFKRQSKCN
eukprot:473135_1